MAKITPTREVGEHMKAKIMSKENRQRLIREIANRVFSRNDDAMRRLSKS